MNQLPIEDIPHRKGWVAITKRQMDSINIKS
jgi:hypothetical protein